jgi:nucleoside-diphosphate-sugar epimerase
MTVEEARAGNVDTTRAVVELAARLPDLRRLVYVSGYRVSGHAEWDYRRLGAYEASKVEADAVFRARADELGVPWTIVNPASVISADSDQQLGLAASVKQLWEGSLKALPGNAFVPVVSADYLAGFMALVPADPSTVGEAYWLLDDDTPLLPDLLTLVGTHLGVTVPRLRVPLPLVRRLPAWLTKADPETRSFLSADRYPTASAREFAARHDLKMPDVRVLLREWADNLVARWSATR